MLPSMTELKLMGTTDQVETLRRVTAEAIQNGQAVPIQVAETARLLGLQKELTRLFPDAFGEERASSSSALGDPAASSGKRIKSRPGTVAPHVARQIAVADKDDLPGHLKAPRAEVSEFLHSYGVTGRLGRPRERILRWAAELQSILVKEATSEELEKLAGRPLSSLKPKERDRLAATAAGERLISAMMRGRFFSIEDIMRLYKGRYGKPVAHLYDRFKEIEDALGHKEGTRTLADLGAKVGLPEKAQRYLRKRAEEEAAGLVEIIRKHWLPEPGGFEVPALRTLVDTLRKLPWDSYQTDKAFLRQSLAAMMQRVVDKPFNFRDLNGNFGIHELRRQSRRPSMVSYSLDGLVVLDDTRNPVAAYRGLLKNPVADSKYSKVPATEYETENCIRISRSLFVANTILISEITPLKDRAEEIEGLAEAYFHGILEPKMDKKDLKKEKKVEAAMRKAEAAVMKLLPPGLSIDEIRVKAQELYDTAKANGHFEAFVSEYRG